MDDLGAALAHGHPLLDAQLRLLEGRRDDVAGLQETVGEHDVAAPLDAMAEDLVGARLVLRTPPGGFTGTEREALELREREARDLLREVLAVLPPRRCGADAPGGWA